MAKEITTRNCGAKVIFNDASFKIANKLKSVLQKATKAQGYTMADLDSLKTIEVLDVSDELIDILFVCLQRCTYNAAKITEDTFEDVKVRADYYEVLLGCLEVNYTPFVKAPNSKSKELLK